MKLYNTFCTLGTVAFISLAAYCYQQAQSCTELCRFIKQKEREHEERVVSKMIALYGAAYE